MGARRKPSGDTLVVTKLDRLARSLPDARVIADELTLRQVNLSIGRSVYDPTDAVGRLPFKVLATVAKFESDLIRLRTCEGMRVAKAQVRPRGKEPKLNRRQEAYLVSLVYNGQYRTDEVAVLVEQLGCSRRFWIDQRHNSGVKPFNFGERFLAELEWVNVVVNLAAFLADGGVVAAATKAS